MKAFLLCALSIYCLTGCATNEELASRGDRSAPPEYATGSNIAQKSKTRKPDVQTLTAEELEEIQKESSNPIR